MKDEDVAIIFWSSGTTGIPKGIQHTVKYFRAMLHYLKSSKNRVKTKCTNLTTTCYFHVGGFFSPLGITNDPTSYVLNHGPDIEALGNTELLYKEINEFKPLVIICGSHHLVHLSQIDPIDESLDLSSVYVAMPMGSTVTKTLYDDLKKNFKSLKMIRNLYSMTELGGSITKSMDVNCLGTVSEGAIVKFVDPESGKLCGPNEVCNENQIFICLKKY